MTAKIASHVKLANGWKMPVLVLGTGHIGGEFSSDLVSFALKCCNYRHIDTGERYMCENTIAEGIKKSSIARADIFLTSKVWPLNYGYEKTKGSIQRALRKLDTQYLDLFLVHWPDCFDPCPDKMKTKMETWKALEESYEQSLVKAIGVSNYTVSDLQELMSYCKIKPMVNQVEYHVYLGPQEELLQYCKENNIVVQGYCPLARGAIADDKTVKSIAGNHGKSLAQILLRWALQHGVVPIPKSTKLERVKENSQIFDFTLTAEEMSALNSLNQDLHVSWNPHEPEKWQHLIPYENPE